MLAVQADQKIGFSQGVWAAAVLVDIAAQAASAAVQETAVVAQAVAVAAVATATPGRADMGVTAAALTYSGKGQTEARQA